ncbi:hypothetical protein D3752_004088 [Escherichia coli]|uniref:hypothetical protein n=2 Tax=Escherichia coli TaxID=562 RepID=UPI001009D1B2|nr:hypothetical protein [Escherichia coli]EEX1487192.1 hypothetical protein [Escherichia coli]EFB1811220.1 hypothetical protein [Escherichia coli]EFD1113279.1 hypothetical protein [Escherichia coli]EFH5393627.1 hypothetical protein [Escherichia coli]EFI6346921.1 hypothetical protein [Escherichia coli]
MARTMKVSALRLILISMLLIISNASFASSAECSAKAADVYYRKLLTGDRDLILSGLRSGTDGKISPVEISTINGLIFTCEKGIENQSYDTNLLWEYNYKAAKKALIDDHSARAYASAHVEMYNYGKSIR